ncbi:MAG: PSD1 and planctomycete cytochrome C domain-containing protein [Chthoniobacter sp.]|uniref:PSD1 and planctomycete cytochrome C domain-containing protein n=1 Tax=Chthoniobacter sp. TaxID=2510640 RepID=UPI0032A88309
MALLAPASLRAETRELTFEHDVRPILKAHCTQCHGEEEKPKAGVDLRLRRFMDRLTEDGDHILVVGKPDDSEMVRMIREGEMPKKGKKVTPEELVTIERWITQGAKTAGSEPETLAPGAYITNEDRQFWSFKPIPHPAVPQLENATRVRTPIDAFVLAKLRQQKLDFAPDADKRTLIRRVTLDLIGLPPTPEEVAAFLADTAPDAYEKVVDRLLASPAYGECWGRHWLDIAGYADSNGFSEADSPRPQAWRYRDYVIRAYNADKPWRDFIVEQLAGDELAGATQTDFQKVVLDPAKRDDLIATGFLRMAPDGTGDPVDDVKLARNQVIAEELKVVSSSLLGLTVGCAQCHDHRFDPILQSDYYRLRAVFEPAFDWQTWRPPSARLYSLYTPEEQAKADEIEKQARVIDAEAQAMSKKFLDEIFEKEIVKLPEEEREPYRAARAAAVKDRTAEQKALIKKYPNALATYSLDLYDAGLQKKVTDKAAEATTLRATKPPEGKVMALTEVKGHVPETHLFHRGDHDQPKQVLGPGELTVLAQPQIEPFQPAEVPSGSTGRRLAYAQWLVSGQHPLVARVLVNRFWLDHFGRGIVNTPSEFGALGERPTHPELLDWLASEFMDGGWKLKPLHRLMVLSTVYRQSSTNESSLKADAENRFLARFKLQRLEAETLRDSMLAAAGTLNPQAFGEPVGIARDPGGRIVVGQEQLNANRDVIKVVSRGPEDFRRSIFVQVRRKAPLTVLDTFDEPTMSPNCEARNSTTVAPQSLLLMNDNFVLDVAHTLALRLRKEEPGDARGQIVRAWRILYGRDPQETDLLRSLAYLAEQTEAVRAYQGGLPPAKDPKAEPPADPQLEALASLCQVLYSSNRFLYIE